MHKSLAAAALTLALMAAPAFAQSSSTPGSSGSTTPGATTMPGASGAMAKRSRTECESDWKAMDANNDGKVQGAELSATAKNKLPQSLANSTTVSQQEFMTACAQ